MKKKPSNTAVVERPSTPVYKQLADKIRRRIESGEFREGERLPSTKQFSEEFEVNHLTTRQALKVLERESRIAMFAGRGTFVLATKAKAARIAVIVPSLGQQMPGDISRGMRRTVNGGEEVSLTFIDYHEDVGVEQECLERVKTDGFDGVIFFPSLDLKTVKPILELVTTGFPIVFIDRAVAGVPCWLVSSDDVAMGRIAARHLQEAGVGHPACVVSEFSNTLERLRGFRIELNNEKIVLPEDRVMVARAHGDPEGELTRKLLALKKRPDGIFYYNDYQALIGIKIIQEAGLKVPEEVKILGCDDIEAAHLANPGLTSIHQNFQEVGARALKMLMELVRLPVEERFRSRHEIIGVNLVGRQSTAKNA